MTTTSSLSTCIKLHRYVPMPGFLIFPVALCNSFLVMVNATVAAGVLTESLKCLKLVQNKWPRKSLQTRQVKAMGKVMIKFGSNNYFDQQTPFNLMNHALNAAVSVMLLN